MKAGEEEGFGQMRRKSYEHVRKKGYGQLSRKSYEQMRKTGYGQERWKCDG